MLTDSTTPDAPAPDTPPGLTRAQWQLLGGGALLALTGSGLLSVRTLVRLAAVVGGGAMVVRALTSGAPADARIDADAALGGDTAGSVSNLTPSAWAARPSLREGPAGGGADTDGPSAPGAVDIPFGSLRGI